MIALILALLLQPCAVKHPALTGLDRASMAAAYEASFEGAFHRKPTWTRGAGVDDGDFWISASDHYGEYSDGICRAGWNRYRELQLACNGCATDPKLGDQPALFLPTGTTLPDPGTTAPPAFELHDVLKELETIKGILAFDADVLRDLLEGQQKLAAQQTADTEKIQQQLAQARADATATARSGWATLLHILTGGIVK